MANKGVMPSGLHSKEQEIAWNELWDKVVAKLSIAEIGHALSWHSIFVLKIVYCHSNSASLSTLTG